MNDRKVSVLVEKGSTKRENDVVAQGFLVFRGVFLWGWIGLASVLAPDVVIGDGGNGATGRAESQAAGHAAESRQPGAAVLWAQKDPETGQYRTPTEAELLHVSGSMPRMRSFERRVLVEEPGKTQAGGVRVRLQEHLASGFYAVKGGEGFGSYCSLGRAEVGEISIGEVLVDGATEAEAFAEQAPQENSAPASTDGAGR